MQNPAWRKALSGCADPQRARHFLDQFKSTPAGPRLKTASPEQARVLTALFSGSQALSESLIAHPEWLASTLETELLQHPRQEQGLRREVNAWLEPLVRSGDCSTAFAKLRAFKQREMLRIAARDLARLGDVSEITREISNVADLCLQTVCQLCNLQLTGRLGKPYHQDLSGNWQPTGFCVLGLGKLGGQELNYSSDVDVIFLYSAEGFLFKSPPRKSDLAGRGLANHQFFKQLSEAIIAELTRLTPEGTLYRIDLRLRPEGKGGPLARSLASCENYYAQWGQTWERMMLIKARGVAGDPALAAEFLEMIQPFRYPRSMGDQASREVALMKQRIESEVVKAGEIDRNVKLGRGGIREVEFIVQTLQVLHAGRLPFLQEAQTLPALKKLVNYQLLPAAEAGALAEAYCFLREIEHRLQMEDDRQTHTIPTDRKARERLAALMGFSSLAAFEKVLLEHTGNVRRVFDKLIKIEPEKPSDALPPDFDGMEAEWKRILAGHAFIDPEKSCRLLKSFVQGPGYGHTSARTASAAFQLVAKMLSLCRQTAPGKPNPAVFLSDPDRVLARLDSFVTVYGARAMLYEAWSANPSLFQLLLLLFDRSEFLAEVAIRTPDLVDELELSGQLRRRKNAEIILADLRHGLADEDQHLWLRRYHEAELMRIALRDILDLEDAVQTQDELTALADACLRYALEVVLRQNKLKAPPFAIIGLGKLGGQELIYGSDLDIIFVADDKTRNLPKVQQLAVQFMDLLSRRTEKGVVFATDSRLRPDGEKGLLVNTLGAYEEYYRRRAMLWEIQSLTRARPIAGDSRVGGQFQKLAQTLTNFKQTSLPLEACAPQWKEQIHQMRLRIEKERTPAGKHSLAIKTGAGGLVDAEFIAQTLCLAGGFYEPNTLRALERASGSELLPSSDGVLLMENYRKIMAIERILRRWSFESESVLPDDPAPFYRVSVRCGFADSDSFMQAVAGYRAAIRGVYAKVFQFPEKVFRKTDEKLGSS